MNNDLSSYFEDPEFKDLLAKYEGMAESHTPTYFDAEELTDIAEYYAGQGEEKKAEEAIEANEQRLAELDSELKELATEVVAAYEKNKSLV